MQMKCVNGFAIPGTDSPFLFCRPIPLPASSVRYGTRTRFSPVNVRARIVEDGPVNQTMEQRLSFYELLGVPQSGTLPQIKQAYKQLARKYHPDVSPPDRVDEYTDKFIRVQEAYETLTDPRRRAMYDRDLIKGISFAFSGRRRGRYDEDVMEGKSEWKSRWEMQLSGLKQRSVDRDSRGNLSWAARMRQHHDNPSDDPS